ncbi:uncharacterized protein LOC143877202 [Tasmannia lanceolata]|uniref:uncharacterized protein LOC143877202 n=1 Tax=Tasmannia lanceolata TaxID=3420 RepID=UPI0040648DE3
MTTTLPWQPFFSTNLHTLSSTHHQSIQTVPSRHVASIQAFRRSDFDRFAKRVTSGEALRDTWRSANDGFEQLLYEAQKAAERFDRRFSVSRRFESFTRSASYRARELDRELGIALKWRAFSVDFGRNWPSYRKELSAFLESPVGKSIATIFFLWFALSGWFFRFLILATWVLPFAAPLLIGTVANNFVIEGACPACKKPFMGYKNQVICCTSCRNIVWQPGDDSSRGPRPPSSTSGSNIIDIEIEEK